MLILIIALIFSLLIFVNAQAEVLVLSPLPGTDSIYGKVVISSPPIKHHKKHKYYCSCVNKHQVTSKHSMAVMDSDHPTKDPK